MGDYLEIGTQAPEFSLNNQKGEKVSLSDFKGKKIVLYFYPKDMTPGCTTEACDFRDHMAAFEGQDSIILGISKDSEASHLKFAEKNGLTFNLLSDPDGDICEMYGVWQLKKNYGKEYMGIVRTTYIIDENGRIQDVIKVSRVKGHVEKVLEKL